MSADQSHGWDEIAERFMAVRSDAGAGLVSAWAKNNLSPGGSVIDVGCGSGIPVAQALIDAGYDFFGIDASPAMIAAFHQWQPDAQIACETAQESALFDRLFDGAIAIGLLFLLSADEQREVIGRVAGALKPGGRFLFSAPREECEWPDALTGRLSRSLGAQAYDRLLRASGLHLLECSIDEGGNNYFDALKVSGE